MRCYFLYFCSSRSASQITSGSRMMIALPCCCRHHAAVAASSSTRAACQNDAPAAPAVGAADGPTRVRTDPSAGLLLLMMMPLAGSIKVHNLSMCWPALQVCAAQHRLQEVPYSSTVWQASVFQGSWGEPAQHPAAVSRGPLSVWCGWCCRGQGVSDANQQQYTGPPPVRQLMEQAARQWQVGREAMLCSSVRCEAAA